MRAGRGPTLCQLALVTSALGCGDGPQASSEGDGSEESSGGSNTSTSDSDGTGTSGGCVGSCVPEAAVLFFDFEEAGGMDVVDRTMHGHDATIIGSLVRTDGRFGRGIANDGGTAWLEVADDPVLDGSSGFTVEVWASLADAQVSGLLFKGDPGDNGRWSYRARATTDGGITEIYNGCNATSVETGIQPDTWSHIAATWDGAEMAIFVNARKLAAMACTDPPDGSGFPLWIGRTQSDEQQFLHGILDEVAFFDHARTAMEICEDGRGAWNGDACDYS